MKDDMVLLHKIYDFKAITHEITGELYPMSFMLEYLEPTGAPVWYYEIYENTHNELRDQFDKGN